MVSGGNGEWSTIVVRDDINIITGGGEGNDYALLGRTGEPFLVVDTWYLVYF